MFNYFVALISLLLLIFLPWNNARKSTAFAPKVSVCLEKIYIDCLWGSRRLGVLSSLEGPLKLLGSKLPWYLRGFRGVLHLGSLMPGVACLTDDHYQPEFWLWIQFFILEFWLFSYYYHFWRFRSDCIKYLISTIQKNFFSSRLFKSLRLWIIRMKQKKLIYWNRETTRVFYFFSATFPVPIRASLYSNRRRAASTWHGLKWILDINRSNEIWFLFYLANQSKSNIWQMSLQWCLFYVHAYNWAFIP